MGIAASSGKQGGSQCESSGAKAVEKLGSDQAAFSHMTGSLSAKQSDKLIHGMTVRQMDQTFKVDTTYYSVT
jgi:hypothetical protein